MQRLPILRINSLVWDIAGFVVHLDRSLTWCVAIVARTKTNKTHSDTGEGGNMIDRDEACRQVHGLDKRLLFAEGRTLYYHLQRIMKRSVVFPTESDYSALARNLDLTVPYVRKRIEIFLFD